MNEPTRQCTYSIEVRFKGQRYVFSRRQCGNKVKPPADRCHHHKRPNQAEGSSDEG